MTVKFVLIFCLVHVALFETLAEREKRLVCTAYPSLRQCASFNENYQQQQSGDKGRVESVEEKSITDDDDEKKSVINDDDQEEPVVNDDVQEEYDDQEQMREYEYKAGQELLKNDIDHHQAEVQGMIYPDVEPSAKDHGKESVMRYLQEEFSRPITQLLTGLLSAVILGLGLRAMIKYHLREAGSELNATTSEDVNSSADVIQNDNYDGLMEVELGAYQSNNLYEIVSDSNIVQ